MESKREKLLKSTILLSIGNLGSKLLTMLIVPLCTYVIDPSDMSTYDILNTLSQLFVPVAMLGLSEALFRWLLDVGSDFARIMSNWGAIFFQSIMVFTIIYGLTWFAFKFENAWLLYLLILTNCIYVCLQYATRGLHNKGIFAIQGVVYGVVVCLSDYILVIRMKIGYTGLLDSVILANMVSGCIMLIKQPHIFAASIKRVQRDLAIRKQMLVYAFLLVPNGVCWWVMQGSGRIFVRFFLSEADAGVFAISMKFPSLMAMITTVFSLAWQEQAVEEYNNETRDKYYTEIFAEYFKILISTLLVLMPAVNIFIHFFTDSAYHDAMLYSAPLLMGGAFSAFANFYGVAYTSAKKTLGSLLSTGGGAILNVVLNSLLIVPLGVHGAAAAFWGAQMSVWMIRAIHTRKFFSIHINWCKMLIKVFAVTLYGYVLACCHIVIQIVVLCIGGILFLYINRRLITSLLKKLQR